MTDTQKIKLITQMISDVIEYTSFEKDAMDALITCVSVVCAFNEEADDEQRSA